ncbi:hypothetical protein C8J38_10396 [Rhizobium sp. PP-WC-2G-219]|nr:hypothetical protein C8J38_10396 [Rhizobium sp. PP-WC-2G-219]
MTKNVFTTMHTRAGMASLFATPDPISTGANVAANGRAGA